MTHRFRRLLCLAISLGLAAPFGGVTAQTLPSSGELLQQTPRPVLPAPSSDVALTIAEPAPGQLPRFSLTIPRKKYDRAEFGSSAIAALKLASARLV